ncbi:D-3-phosphoglycerate dehydrogenase [plant metagenome]|uniref:D-3-phosphoglycerate dehydrogenase n=1 Tax=plant metagenome TaxID=1297885 RepID=A0A484UJW7_9ZZZZ
MIRVFLNHSPRMRENYYGEQALSGLRALADVRLNARDAPLSPREMIDAAQGCQVIIGARVPAVPAQVFASLPELVAFCRVAVDVSNIDLAAASQHGVLVTRASPGFGPSVAEWIVGAMIDLDRGISDGVGDYRAGRAPRPRMGRQLAGATLGIVGYGTIGRYLARLGLALGMDVVVHDPFQADAAPCRRADTLAALLAQSDHVVCLAASVPQTANLFNDAAFAAMKPDACFINASRGELVDEAALLRALDAGRLAGCALDVGRAPDQMPSPTLAGHPKVIASPHVGGLTPQAVAHQALDTVAQVGAMLRGEAPAGALNLDHATRFRERFMVAGANHA